MNEEERKLIAAMPDQEVMARTMYGEARGEGVMGICAVANVIMNRYYGKSWYGAGITSVCLKKYQFSCWNDRDPNLKHLLKPKIGGILIERCRAIAELAAEELLKDNTYGATHYHSKKMRQYPFWATQSAMKKRAEIGNHIFYQEL